MHRFMHLNRGAHLGAKCGSSCCRQCLVVNILILMLTDTDELRSVPRSLVCIKLLLAMTFPSCNQPRLPFAWTGRSRPRQMCTRAFSGISSTMLLLGVLRTPTSGSLSFPPCPATSWSMLPILASAYKLRCRYHSALRLL